MEMIKKKRCLKKSIQPLWDQKATEEPAIKVFFEDEARFGRINTISRCWVPKGERAHVKQQMIREHTYAFTAVCPLEGETYSLIVPFCNTEAMNALLQGLSRQYSQYQIVLLADRAGWHRSKELILPANIRIILLPPYSPELNPTEHIWDYIREQKEFNNYTFQSLNEVEDHLEKVLRQLHNEKNYIQSLCTFNWMTTYSP